MTRSSLDLLAARACAVAAMMAGCSSAQAQCAGLWIPRAHQLGIGRQVLCVTTWASPVDADGRERLIFGGTFDRTGEGEFEHIVEFDGQHFASVGSGISGGRDPGVHSLTTFNGRLIAGGCFDFAGGVRAGGVAAWDGTTWAALGTGFAIPDPPSIARVFAVGVHQNQLYAGGQFTIADGSPASFLARWDGSHWRQAAPGLTNAVRAMTSYGGKLVVGGEFGSTPDQPGSGIAAWDGVRWSRLGSIGSGVVLAFAQVNGTLYAGGNGINTADGFDHVARYDQASDQWVRLDRNADIDQTVYGLTAYRGGLAIFGSFVGVPGVQSNYAIIWDGQRYQPLALGFAGGTEARGGVEWNGGLVVGGFFEYFNSSPPLTATGNWAIWSELPVVSDPPHSAVVCPSKTAVLSISTIGQPATEFAWQIEQSAEVWTTLHDGDNAYGCGFANAEGTSTATLRLRLPVCASFGRVRSVVSNACGSVASTPATLRVCRVDVNCDGFVDFFDYGYFVNAFQAGTADSDFNGDGFVDFFDYNDFVAAFEAGC